ncbi:alpha-L-fucosidase [Planotetraspora phitsanulokensis]|uniref:Alpha-L-fucosidase n=1 Tax=Planotetraspora phitsanulokensis TaxID=575192 RepID=A0A8J3U0U9_9ACTN|nr:discoidin domain-containing protein [Planotetraspora phitsanulokensis]GII36433.1 alpha-L-fucosidase [Planotetraspora phitsanulokensis]
MVNALSGDGDRMTRRRRRTVAVAVAAMVALVLNMITVGPARADLQNPRQEFLRSSVGGLFLHWGERTAPQHTDCAQWEADVTNGGWTPDYWLDEAQKLHTQYIVLATFHSRLGYARPWPSAIPGSCSTKRDFLGELVDAAKPRGMKVILYMTDDPQWHTQGLTSGSWLDSAAYSAYKGHDVDITTRDGFGEFSYDNFFEVMKRYPDLGGFWIDNDNAYWERNHLYEQIHQLRPNYTLSNNNEDTPEMDMVSNEQKTGMTPSYDYPQAVYTAQPRLTEADFKLPTTGNWWYDGVDPSVDYRVSLGRLITNVGSSVKALMDEQAMVNGHFPPKQEAFNNFADDYLDQIWESLNGVEGGGYMYGGLEPGGWNDGAHGVTTISRTDPNLHYIHVVTPPTGTTTLKLGDNGYKIKSVTNLRTGAELKFSQSNGTLAITGISEWDPYDTVLKVTSNGRAKPYPGVTVTASASAAGHDATAAGDGDYLTYWDNNKTLPVSLDFDLGDVDRARYIGLNQREDSVSYARSATEQSARIRDYEVYASDDGVNWGAPVKIGTLPSQRGVQIVDLPHTTARHVRLRVLSTYAASTDTTRYKRLRIDEAWVGNHYVRHGEPIAEDGAGGGVTLPVTIEAETGVLSGSARADACPGCSGGAKVRFIGNNTANYATYNVNMPAAGDRQLTIAGEVSGTRSFSVSVNGGTPVTATLTGTTWDSPTTTTVTVPMNAGINTLKFYNDTANAPDLDSITIS